MIKETDNIDFSELPAASKHYFKLNLIKNALGDNWQVPVMVVKGKPGKVIGITAAVHGNELNGIPTIHEIWNNLQPNAVHGIVVLVPVVNVSGFMSGTREFFNGNDLNRIVPGKKHGATSERYIYEFLNRLGRYFDYHLDLHTASEGRVNSYYIKANFELNVVEKMASLLAPQIVVNCPAPKGSLRAYFDNKEIPSITLELGDPNKFQSHHIEPAYIGIMEVLEFLKMIPKFQLENGSLVSKRVESICKSSEWLYAKHGGILDLYSSSFA